jgi:PadR family transcriptional regulator, regulatory protein PadR
VPQRSDMLRDFFRGFVKIHILYHVSHEAVYGVQFIAELARHGYQLSPGTLYPLLHSLEESGYVMREDRVVEGKVRKYYRITSLGEQVLAEARSRIHELVDEVLEDHAEPMPDVDNGETSAAVPRKRRKRMTAATSRH